MAGRARGKAATLAIVVAGCAASTCPGAAPAPTASPAPSVAVVACSDNGTRLSSPAVATEPGGVRVRFEHPGPVPGEGPWSVGWLDPEAGEVLQEGAPGGVTELFLPLPPGDESVLVCIPPFGDHLSPSRQARPVVLDADGRPAALPPPDPRALRVDVTAEVRGPLAEVLEVEVGTPDAVAPGGHERHPITFRTTIPDTILDEVVTVSAKLSAESGPGRLGVTGVCGPGWAPDGTPVRGDPCAAAEPFVEAQPGAPLDLALGLHGSPEHGDIAPGRYTLEVPLTPYSGPNSRSGTLIVRYNVH